MKSGTGCSYENNDAVTSQHFDNDETTLSRTSAWKIQTIENMSRCNSVPSKQCQRYSGPESWVLNWPVKLTWSLKSVNKVASFVQLHTSGESLSKVNITNHHRNQRLPVPWKTMNNAMTPVFHKFLPRKTFRKNLNIFWLFPWIEKKMLAFNKKLSGQSCLICSLVLPPQQKQH